MSSTSIVDDIFMRKRGSTYFNLSPMKLKRISIFIWIALVRFILFILLPGNIKFTAISLFHRTIYKRVKLCIVMHFKMEYHEPYGKVGYK